MIVEAHLIVLVSSSATQIRIDFILEPATLLFLIINAFHAEIKLLPVARITMMKIVAALTAHTEFLHITAALTEKNGMQLSELAKLLHQQTLAQEAVLVQSVIITAQVLALAKISAAEQQEADIAKHAALWQTVLAHAGTAI